MQPYQAIVGLCEAALAERKEFTMMANLYTFNYQLLTLPSLLENVLCESIIWSFLLQLTLP
jgi:hypothetical protein